MGSFFFEEIRGAWEFFLKDICLANADLDTH